MGHHSYDDEWSGGDTISPQKDYPVSENMDDTTSPKQKQEKPNDEVAVNSGGIKKELAIGWTDVEMILKGTKFSFGGDESDNELDDENPEPDVDGLIRKLKALRKLTSSIEFVERGAAGQKGKGRTKNPNLTDEQREKNRYNDRVVEVRGQARIDTVIHHLKLCDQRKFDFEVEGVIFEMERKHRTYKKGDARTKKFAQRNVAKNIIKKQSAEKRKEAETMVKSIVCAKMKEWKDGGKRKRSEDHS